MKERTIVTAFFDIARGDMKAYSRSNEKYIRAFKFWARIKNNIVVYSDLKTLEEVKKIRKEYKLLEKTTLIEIKDYLEIDNELYKSIDHVMLSKQFLDFHIQRNIPEACSSKYNYIMTIKSWCCADAVEKGYAKGMVAWIDFGFNYGGEYYRNEEEFDFLWEYNFSEKIHLLEVHKVNEDLPFEIIRRNDSFIQGGEIIAPDFLWAQLWSLVRKNMFALNCCGLADDDQILYLMSYRQRPDIFELHECEWLGLFKYFGNKDFTFIPPKRSCIDILKGYVRHPFNIPVNRKFIYIIRTFVELMKWRQKA